VVPDFLVYKVKNNVVLIDDYFSNETKIEEPIPDNKSMLLITRQEHYCRGHDKALLLMFDKKAEFPPHIL
jgi:hypothetical protein